MLDTYKAASDIDVIASAVPIPGLGIVPVNAFVLRGSEPLLIDTGVVAQRDEFMQTLKSVIDIKTLRWIWLTHTDPDHTGSLSALLAENPSLRVITTFFGVGIMGLIAPLPLDRIYLLNPGQRIVCGDRTLTAVRPPVYDNPTTTGCFDHSSGTLLCADSMGALLSAVPRSATELSPEELHRGQTKWATIDAPWLHGIDRSVYARSLDTIRSLQPSLVLSSHLPPAPGAMLDTLLTTLAGVPDAEPFVGPDQAALQQMLAGMAGS